MRKGPRRFGSSAQKYESKLGRPFLEEHHKPSPDAGVPPQKSEPKIGVVTKSRFGLGDLLALSAKLLSSAVQTRAFAEHTKHDRSPLFELAHLIRAFRSRRCVSG
jgi:hypothetical protein